MDANYFERQIAYREHAARGFDAQAVQAHDAGDRDRAERLNGMARAERHEAAQFRRRLACI